MKARGVMQRRGSAESRREGQGPILPWHRTKRFIPRKPPSACRGTRIGFLEPGIPVLSSPALPSFPNGRRAPHPHHVPCTAWPGSHPARVRHAAIGVNTPLFAPFAASDTRMRILKMSIRRGPPTLASHLLPAILRSE